MCTYLSDSSPIDMDKFSEYEPSSDLFVGPSSNILSSPLKPIITKKHLRINKLDTSKLQHDATLDWKLVDTQMNLSALKLAVKCERSILLLGAKRMVTPLDFLKLLFDSEVQGMILRNTNLDSLNLSKKAPRHKSKLTRNVSREEL